MLHTARSVRLAAFISVLALTALPSVAAAPPAAAAQAATAVETPGQPPAPAAVQLPTVFASDFDAERLRTQFYEVLQKYPPSLGRVLKLDPSLMANEAYLLPYPGVAAFLSQHPEIARNPSYFLERVNIGIRGPNSAASCSRWTKKRFASSTSTRRDLSGRTWPD